jgi:hypothetical protein
MNFAEDNSQAIINKKQLDKVNFMNHFQDSYSPLFTDDEVHILEECNDQIFSVEHTPHYLLLDTGATCHAVGNKELFMETHKCNREISTLKHTIPVTEEGTIKVGNILVKNVAYVRNSRNILSFKKFRRDHKLSWSGQHDKIYFRKKGKVVCTATEKGNFFLVNIGVPSNTILAMSNDLRDMKEIIHDIHVQQGHGSAPMIQNQIEQKSGKLLPLHMIQSCISNCECKIINITKKNGKSPLLRATSVKPGERIHVDLIGKVGSGYLFVALDKASNYLFGEVIKSRAVATQTAISALNFFRNHLALNKLFICSIRADNEFRTNQFIEYCTAKGILLEFTAPASSPENGAVERANRTLQNNIRLLLQSAHIPSQYWNFAARHFIFLQNHFTFNKNGLTPWETFRMSTSSIPKDFALPPFGCKIAAYNENRVQKVFTENFTGVFLGFDHTTKIAFALLPNQKIIRTSSFVVIRDKFPFITNDFYQRQLESTLEAKEAFSFGRFGFPQVDAQGNGGTTSTSRSKKKSVKKVSKEFPTQTFVEDGMDTSPDPETPAPNTLVTSNTETTVQSAHVPTVEAVADNDVPMMGTEEYPDDGPLFLPVAGDNSLLTSASHNTQMVPADPEQQLTVPHPKPSKKTGKKPKTVSRSNGPTSKVPRVNLKLGPPPVRRMLSAPPEQAPADQSLALVPYNNQIAAAPQGTPNNDSMDIDTSGTVTPASDAADNTNAPLAQLTIQYRPELNQSMDIDTSGTAPPVSDESTSSTIEHISKSPSMDVDNNTDSTCLMVTSPTMEIDITEQGQRTRKEALGTTLTFSRKVRKFELPVKRGEQIDFDTTSVQDQINLLASTVQFEIPKNFKDIKNIKESGEWEKACTAEMDVLDESEGYEVVKLRNIGRVPVIKGRWAFNVKIEPDGTPKFKARLVAKGFTKEVSQNYLEAFSPAICMDSVRFILSLCAINKWHVKQMDAKNSFLNGKLKYRVYYKPPPGCDTEDDEAWLLQKAFPGLENAPLIFYETFANVLYDHGFVSSALDPCLLYHPVKKIYITMYVNDLLIVSEKEEYMQETKKILESFFEMKDIGIPKMFLGMNVNYHSPSHIELSMKGTIDRIRQNYDILPGQGKCETPLVQGFDAKDVRSPLLVAEERKTYRSIIGSLIYIANTVRLDIAYAVSLLSRYLDSPRKCHLNAGKRVLQYLVKSNDRGLHFTDKQKNSFATVDYRLVDTNKKAIIHDYEKSEKYVIKTVSDASYANEEERRSQHGYVTYMNNNIIQWSSKKQDCVALSTAEAEYIGITEACKSSLFFTHLLKELRLPTNHGVICGDNISSLQMSSHKVKHQKTKHIDIRYHFIREKVLARAIKLEYINTKNNIADGLTKNLDRLTLNRLNTILFHLQ